MLEGHKCICVNGSQWSFHHLIVGSLKYKNVSAIRGYILQEGRLPMESRHNLNGLFLLNGNGDVDKSSGFNLMMKEVCDEKI